MDNGELIGAVLRTKRGVKPIYVSCGHLVNLDSAIRVVLECCRGYRLPEPTRQAHIFVNEVRRRVSASNLASGVRKCTSQDPFNDRLLIGGTYVPRSP